MYVHVYMCVCVYMGASLVARLVKNGVCVYIYISACNAGDQGLTPWSGISPGEGNGNPLQYSCLENSLDRGAWCATVYGSPKVRND